MIDRLVIGLILSLLSVGVAIAIQPNEILKDPELEARARQLSKEIRCLVCQNQSIDDSNADLARDLRALVREHIRNGSNDQEILDYLVKRYGDFVLLKPPVKASTYLLWYGPVAILLLGALGLIVFFRVSRPIPMEQNIMLSDEERQKVQVMLEDPDKGIR